jgi:hypothetical protein
MNLKYIFILLLFCVSCNHDKALQNESIHADLINLENKVQQLNCDISDIGTSTLNEIKSEISTTKGPDNEARLEKLKAILNQMEQINAISNEFLIYIDKLKMNLLKLNGENTTEDQNKNERSLIWVTTHSREVCMPKWLNLSALKNKNDSKTAMELFINSDNEKPSKIGFELWTKLIDFRSNIINLTGSYQNSRDEPFHLHVLKINDFKNDQDFDRQLKQMFDQQKNFNKKDDEQLLCDIYKLLTKPTSCKEQNGIHWITSKFRSANIIGAIGTLTTLQTEILTARKLALQHIISKMNRCGYGFNEILSLAKGPSTARVGDLVDLTVLMAAFDSYDEPEVTVNVPKTAITYPQNGTGVVHFKPLKEGLQTVSGTITLRNKSGIPKTENWEYTINVLPKNKK